MSQTAIFTFKNVSSYEKYKQEVTARGGTIKHDLGSNIRGFTAVIPSTFAQSINSNSLSDSGISTFDLDSVVTTQ